MRKLLALAVCLMLSVPADAGPRGGSSSGGSSSGGSSRPSSGGSSSWGGGSKSGSSWGGGSSSSKPSGSSNSSSSSSSSSGGSSSSWSGGGSKTISKTPISGKEPISVSKKPTSPGFDTLAKTDAKKAESRANYEKSKEPAPTYKSANGKESPIDSKSKEVERLRGELDHQKWVNRQQRSTTIYSTYSASPVVFYADPFHPMMNYWLLSQSIDTMALMIYHHQATMDAARINAMYAQNADLRSRVAALEAAKTVRDPSWSPPGVDRDLLYSDEYVDAVYNPESKTEEEYEYGGSSAWAVLGWICVIVCLIALLFGLAYLFFGVRWDA